MASKKKLSVTLSDAIAKRLAAMQGAIKAEADLADAHLSAMTATKASAWETCRDAVLATLNRKPAKKDEFKPVQEAKALVDALREFCKEAKKTQESMGRGTQYASDLGRAVRLVEAGKALPAELSKATRSAWNEHECWKKAGILKSSGKKPGATGNGKPEASEDEDDAGKAAEKAANAKDKAHADFMGIYGQLRGNFRANFIAEATKLAEQFLNKQRLASQDVKGTKPEAATA